MESDTSARRFQQTKRPRVQIHNHLIYHRITDIYQIRPFSSFHAPLLVTLAAPLPLRRRGILPKRQQ